MLRLKPFVLGSVVSVLTALGVVGAMWVVIGFEVGLHGGRPPLIIEAATVAVVCLGVAAGLVAYAAAAREAEPTLPSS